MNYEQAMAFLEDTKKYGSQLGLTSITNLMHELGDVQDEIPVVHIAGTNGKGSVGAMLSAVITEAGYKTGRFNTPDVFAYEEEFLMNGLPIGRERLAELFTRVAEACERLVDRGLPHPTRFEVETAAAFLWFFEEKCDLAIVEVGMGGETDATNLIRKPVLSILTAISMDHMQFLGNTLAEIADVKAGIIKPDCPVVSMHQDSEVMDVIARRCELTGSKLTVCERPETCAVISSLEELSFLWDMSVFPERRIDQNIEIPGAPIRMDGVIAANDSTREKTSDVSTCRVHLGVRGTYQVENAICTLTALDILQPFFPHITRAAVINGLRSVRWPGRFEQIHAHPYIYLDGAHNEDAAKKLRASADVAFSGRRILYIMGVLADKEYDKIIPIMLKEGDRVFTVTPPNPRALGAKELAQILKQRGIHANACDNVKEAVAHALEEAQQEDAILVFGSLYYLGEVRSAFYEQLRQIRDEKRMGLYGQMKFVDRILHHPQYRQILNQIALCEADRIYCHHDLRHALDVCRIAWILYLEGHPGDSPEKLAQIKERLYVTGLLHDVGRVVQYRTGEHHSTAGARLAGDFLEVIGYPQEWRDETIQIISEHSGRGEKEKAEARLDYYIEQADHLSRNCFYCEAWDSCKWTEEEKNRSIV